MPVGDTRANAILDAILGSGHAAGFPATVYVALYTAEPDESGGGTEGGYPNYARVAVANTTAQWPAASAREKANANRITFPTPNANSGNFLAVAVHGHATNDDIIAFEVLASPLSALSGEPLYIEAGDLIVTIP